MSCHSLRLFEALSFPEMKTTYLAKIISGPSKLRFPSHEARLGELLGLWRPGHSQGHCVVIDGMTFEMDFRLKQHQMLFIPNLILLILGISPGIMVMEGDSRFRGHEFESQHWMSNVYIYLWQNHIVVRKDRKYTKKTPRTCHKNIFKLPKTKFLKFGFLEAISSFRFYSINKMTIGLV